MSARLIRMCGWLMVLFSVAMASLTGLVVFTETSYTFVTPAVLWLGTALASLMFFRVAKRQDEVLSNFKDEVEEAKALFIKDEEYKNHENDFTSVDDEVTEEDKRKLWDITERHGDWG